MINNTREQLSEDVGEYLLKKYPANHPIQSQSWDEIDTDKQEVRNYLDYAIAIWFTLYNMEKIEDESN